MTDERKKELLMAAGYAEHHKNGWFKKDEGAYLFGYPVVWTFETIWQMYEEENPLLEISELVKKASK